MVKRLIDLAFSLVLLTMLTPVWLSVAIAVRWKLGAPILFVQQRPGLYEKPFKLFKFRTMTNDLDDKGSLEMDNKRLTKLGQFLRKYSLDELPQLVNVLKGEMSLVGPRPLLMEYLPLYTKEQALRHHVKPGITGYAQVNGRNAITWEEKFKLDTWYVIHRSVWLDIKIIILTIMKVVKKEGITNGNHVTVEKFKGSEDVM